jgi:nucleotide-binding universal stress UspA family protein
MSEIKRDKYRVVIGVDFAESSTHAIYEAVHLAQRLPNADLNFVHVMEAPSDLHDARVIDQLSERLGRTMMKLESYVRDAMFVFGGQNPSGGCDVAFHVRIGPPARELHQVAVDVDAEMIIVGAAPPRGPWGLLGNTNTRRLLRSAHVPVVVAHPKDFRKLAKSPIPDPPRPGQDLSHAGMSTYAYVDFASHRDSHISGLL